MTVYQPPDSVSNSVVSHQAHIFAALAEHAKTPLVAIAREAEVGRVLSLSGGDAQQSFVSVQEAAQAALQMFDAYTLALELSTVTETELVPVSVAAIFDDVAHRFSPLARRYDVTLQVDTAKRSDPVLAHPRALTAALASVIQSAVLFTFSDDEQSAADSISARRVTLASHRTAQRSLVAGVFLPPAAGVQAHYLKKSERLLGRARQVMPVNGSESGAGIYIASLLMQYMKAELRMASHRRLQGFGVTLPFTHQLSLI